MFSQLYFIFSNENKTTTTKETDNVQGKMCYFKIVARPVLTYRSNLPCLFFTESIGEYHNVQDQTAC